MLLKPSKYATNLKLFTFKCSTIFSKSLKQILFLKGKRIIIMLQLLSNL